MNKYRNELGIFLLWAVCVVVFFKFIENRQVAALIAGMGFIFWPALFLYLEFRSDRKNKIHVFALSLFLVVSAIPIFLLRVLNWGVDFSTLSLFGIPAEQFHRSSNLIYLIVMVSCLYHSWKFDRDARLAEASRAE